MLVVLLVFIGVGDRAAQAAERPPTIVLVHGAFADASSWDGVSAKLQREGFTVLAPAIPLRGVASDSDYLASIVKTISGPIVLAGHSYAGAVIGQAASDLRNVRGWCSSTAWRSTSERARRKSEPASLTTCSGPH